MKSQKRRQGGNGDSGSEHGARGARKVGRGHSEQGFAGHIGEFGLFPKNNMNQWKGFMEMCVERSVGNGRWTEATPSDTGFENISLAAAEKGLREQVRRPVRGLSA